MQRLSEGQCHGFFPSHADRMDPGVDQAYIGRLICSRTRVCQLSHDGTLGIQRGRRSGFLDLSSRSSPNQRRLPGTCGCPRIRFAPLPHSIGLKGPVGPIGTMGPIFRSTNRAPPTLFVNHSPMDHWKQAHNRQGGQQQGVTCRCV